MKLNKGKKIKPKVSRKEVLYGFHPVMESMRVQKRQIFKVFMDQTPLSKRKQDVLSWCEKKGIEREWQSPAALSKMAGSEKHQGICALVSPIRFSSIEAVLERTSNAKSDPFFLMLDSILDPQNFGALLRTAYCAGVDGVVITKDRSSYPTPSVSKTSAGAMEHMDLICVTNMVSTMRMMKKEDIWICGLDVSGKTSLFKANFKGPTALIIGGEQKGIRPLIKTQCDFLVHIPQKGSLNSMNASAAGAVAMYEVFRQHG